MQRSRLSRRLRKGTTLAASVGLLLAGAAYAQDLSQIPQSPPTAPATIQILGAQNFTWDSNPLLLTTGQKSLFGSTTAPEIIFADNSPTSQFSMDTLLDENLYNQSAFDSTDLHEKIGLSEQMEQWAVGINGQADYDTTRTSELTTFGLNLPRVRHLGLSIAPTISYSPTAVDKLSIAGSVLKSTYDNNAFSDYETFSVNPSWAHSFDALNTATLTLQTQRYETTQNPNFTVDSIGPTLGWTAILTPRLTAKLSGGVERSAQDGPGNAPSTTDWNYIFSADLAFKGEQDTTDVSATRSQYPFENGTETLLTAFTLNESHALNEKIALTATGGYEFAAPPSNAVSISLDTQYNAGAGMAYHLTDQIDLGLSYKYTNETLNGVNGNIEDQSVLLSLTFHPMAKAL